MRTGDTNPVAKIVALDSVTSSSLIILKRLALTAVMIFSALALAS